MPNWHQINNELQSTGSPHDVIRRKYLSVLHEKTNRNVIVYYSGWLQKPEIRISHVNDADKNGFMTVIHNLDRTKGLDLILHTPGGDTAATESLVDYLKAMFGGDIRAIIPQLALSAGTMIACASKEIIMGCQSSLGPIDPQLNGLAAHGVIEEFIRAHKEIRLDQSKMAVWQPIIAKYAPTFIGECEKSIEWSNKMVKEWLLDVMLKDKDDKETIAKTILVELGDHSVSKSHARHLSAKKCKDIGLNITMMEDDQELQDAILSVHHACIHTLSSTDAFKIIENQNGVAFIQSAKVIIQNRM